MMMGLRLGGKLRWVLMLVRLVLGIRLLVRLVLVVLGLRIRLLRMLWMLWMLLWRVVVLGKDLIAKLINGSQLGLQIVLHPAHSHLLLLLLLLLLSALLLVGSVRLLGHVRHHGRRFLLVTAAVGELGKQRVDECLL